MLISLSLSLLSLALSSPVQGAVFYAAKIVAAVQILSNDASIQFSAEWVTVAEGGAFSVVINRVCLDD